MSALGALFALARSISRTRPKLRLSEKHLTEIYGNPSSSQRPWLEDQDWCIKNLITVRDLPGVPEKWHFRCHKLVEPHLRNGLAEARLADPAYKIARAGGYVYRRKQWDTPEKAIARKNKPPLRSLSTHARGMAIDIDSELNRGVTFPALKTPVPWSPAWMKIWPKGLTREFVEGMEAWGWEWGGRWRGFVDPMHFQFALDPRVSIQQRALTSAR